jgi:hypothetical protein
VEVDDDFLPTILTLVGEVFSTMLGPEDCAINFLLDFKGLAKASSYVEVRDLEWDDPLPRLHFFEAFLGTGAGTAAADLCFRTMGLGQG